MALSAVNCFAISGSDNNPQAKRAQGITRQEHELELDLFRLRAEVKSLRNQYRSQLAHMSYAGGQVQASTGHQSPLKMHSSSKYKKAKHISSELFTRDPLLGTSGDVQQKIHQAAINYINGITVLTSPILGLKSAWMPTDLLYTVPSMNEDLRLLQDRQGFQAVLKSLGSSLDMRPLLVVSGGVEGTTVYTSSYVNANSLSVNLSTSEIDLWPIMSSWASGYFSIDFDSSPPQTGTRVANSRLFLSRGFLTIGNLDVVPLYVTVGQMYIPFGRYASAMITTPLTMSMARSDVRTLLLGYYHQGLYAEGYVFNGNRESGGDRFILQSGANIGYKNKRLSVGAIDFGVGFTSNIADSQGMQNNALASGGAIRGPSLQFAGFARTFLANSVDSDNLKHNVGALDFHLEYTVGKNAILLEFITATRQFDPGDLLMNGHGASPKAMHIEYDYNTKYGRFPITYGLAFGRTWQALALNLPKYSYFATIGTSPWKDTQLAIEYRHDSNYARNANVGGGGNGNVANLLPVPTANVGGSRDLVTILLGVYF